jgi:phage I-like protein
LATGDYDQAAEIQEQMIINQSKLSTLENGRKAKEEAPKIAPVVSQSNDLVENLASQVTPESAQWLRQNKDHLNNPKKLDRAMRAHADALDDGIIADTPEYFRYIENRLGISKAQAEEYENPMSDASKPVTRRSAPPAAPVTRSGTGTGTTRPNVVRLTSAEREMAAMMQMTDQEYARNKIALQREGKM